eukprot:TRINITY_DN2512_c0_g1_i1.p1 TRINITY_DN2512_c0_g1~~TRINITY_DN2512_c0_g1_i1.p1  ORF type:complete len:228 (-),score=67.96 TRINITY_DN2512_c0_g1_i1:319-1002(-)
MERETFLESLQRIGFDTIGQDSKVVGRLLSRVEDDAWDFSNMRLTEDHVDAIVEALALTEGVRQLCLSNCKINSENLRKILIAVAYQRGLELLDMSKNPFIGDEAVDDIVELIRAVYHGRKESRSFNPFEIVFEDCSFSMLARERIHDSLMQVVELVSPLDAIQRTQSEREKKLGRVEYFYQGQSFTAKVCLDDSVEQGNDRFETVLDWVSAVETEGGSGNQYMGVM